MEEFKIFVTFHGFINESCYSELSPEEFSHFVFVAVNEKRQKTYPQDPKYKIIKEWELPIYDPELQRKGYNENSVIYKQALRWRDSCRVLSVWHVLSMWFYWLREKDNDSYVYSPYGHVRMERLRGQLCKK